MALIQRTLPYADGLTWLTHIKKALPQCEWPMLLESGQLSDMALGQADAASRAQSQEEQSLGARFDLVVANPYLRFCHQDQHTTITQGAQSQTVTGDPFQRIAEALQVDSRLHAALKAIDVPFAGGAMGYFAYDLGREIETLPSIACNDTPVPALMVGLYDWVIVVDHHQQSCQLVSCLRDLSETAFIDLHQTLIADAPIAQESGQFKVCGPLTFNLDAISYAKAFEQVKAYIAAGDCYQINLAQRMSVPVSGDGLVAYQHFRQLSRAPFMAYLAFTDNHQQPIEVLSMSPERFLQVRESRVETRPIKGTRPRHPDPIQDDAIAQALAASEKDRAENVMIVDLLRNDIGKVCNIGSVQVTDLFRLQRFTNVHHMVSIIQGQLSPQATALDLLRACFPGGSITGAPKLRAMEIIESLEPHRRQVYCGSIGYVGFDGSMDTNIAIRTALIYRSQMTFYAGGGVVADSDCAKEYQETLDKASQFLKLVQHFTAS